MALGDIVLSKDGQFGAIGSRRYVVDASATIIYPGDPVAKALGGTAVTRLATNKPVVATDFLAGVAASTSTNTAAAAGVVDVTPLVPGQVWLISPAVAATWDTQAEYDALVGARVLLSLSAGGVYTILAADNSSSGCVIEPLDIVKTPGKVAFSFRNGCSYLA